MSTIEETFGSNLDNIVNAITNEVVDYQKKKQQEEERLAEKKKQQAEQQRKKNGTITPRPTHSNDVNVGELVFNLSNHTIGDVWCLPANRRRIDDIMKHSKYTYLDAVIASTINAALEGDMAAAKLILSFIHDYTESEEKSS